MRMSALVLLASIAAGCEQERETPTNLANSSAPVAEDDASATSSTGAPPRTTSAAADVSDNQAAPSAARIPPLLHGRWGLSPQDCTSTGATGLLVISADQLRFYESRAVPTATVTKAADSISGEFQFTGEGQSWTKFVALERRPDGLVRTERNPNESLTYARCD